MNKIIVVGSSNTDLVFRLPKLPQAGETVMGLDFQIVQGGKGANQAVAAARAGARVVFISKIGDDAFGSQALKGYQLDHIDTRYIQTDISHPTGAASIFVDAVTGQNSIVVAPGANSYLSVADIQKAKTEIQSATALLTQLEIPLVVVLCALKLAKEIGVKTILNPAPAQSLSDEIYAQTDIITPNETETEILTGIRPIDEPTAKKAALLLLEKVNEAVVITMGIKGVYYAHKNGGRKFMNAENVVSIDTTAAGDVFNGYLAVAVCEGISFSEAVHWANRAAAISVTRNGAQPSIPFKAELNEFLF